ncbi:MAG TPA: hypothetical protein PLW35_11135, partial [Verrucomicrobiota bacterium]|nr:hypothetical protein [Verrucomicrobiota bacterium]
QRDDRPYDPFGSRKCGARTFTGWGCTNNVSVPISASEGFHHRLRQPPIRTRGDLRATPLSLSKSQTTCLSPYLHSCWMCQGGRQRVLNQFILPSALSLPLPPPLEAERACRTVSSVEVEIGRLLKVRGRNGRRQHDYRDWIALWRLARARQAPRAG